jgi:hypothetical protein
MDGERAGSRALRILRSALLAGAGAAVWLALSAGTASADARTGPDHSPGSIATSPAAAVASTLQSATNGVGKALNVGLLGGPPPTTPAASAPVPDESGPTPVTAPSPVAQLPVAPVAEAVDQLAASVPLVGNAVPEGTVSTVTSPGTGSIHDGLGGAFDTVAPALEGVVPPVVDEALQPVVEAVVPPVVEVVEPVVAAVAPLPDPVVSAPVPFGDLFGAAPGTVQGLASAPADGGTVILPPAGVDPAAPLLALTGDSVPKGTTLPPGSMLPSAPPVDPDGPDPGAPYAWPTDFGIGSSHASTDSPGGSAAWLQGSSLFRPPARVLNGPPANTDLPLPMSFDPGSSPD